MSGKLFAAAWSLKDATAGSVLRSLPTKCWNEFGPPLTFGFALAFTRARVFLTGTQFTPRRFDAPQLCTNRLPMICTHKLKIG